MSADVPRRLPPTQGERVRNIDRSHASLSARGRTASARPVPQQPASAQIYRPPVAATSTDRLVVATDVGAFPSSSTQIAHWAYTYEADGTSISLGAPDDGGIYLNAPGIYALTIKLYSSQIHLAAASCAIGALADSNEFTTTPAAQFRGGDGAPGFTMSATASTTQVCRGRGTSGGVWVTVLYQNLDPVVTDVGVEVNIQRIT